MTRLTALCAALFVLLGPVPAIAAEFAPVFTRGAVLQRDEPVSVWGTGRPGEAISVELVGAGVAVTASTTASTDGRWRVTLPAVAATPLDGAATLRLVGDNTVTLSDIAVGEVWLGLGQSNMEWRLNQCGDYTTALLASAADRSVRHLKIPHRANPADLLSAFAWQTFDRASAPQFSAVAYFFAAELRRRLGVTVGIVNCSYGGTPIEAWMSREALAAAGFQSALAEHDRKLAAWPDSAAYEQAWRDYDAAKKAYDSRKKANPSDPALGSSPVEPYGVRNKSRPTGLHAAMLAVITPYTARGALWYQGETNAGRPADYARLLPAFLAQLRAEWARPEFPVFIAQLSSPGANHPDAADTYPKLRDVQRAVAAADPRSGLVVTLDRGLRGDVHPPDKQPVGERFARLALARAYGQTGFAAQSPVAITATRSADHVVVAFSDLPAAGRLELRDPAVAALELQRPDGSWVPAGATLSADARQLLVALPADTPAPIALRYAWRNFCALTLFTYESLPVSPWQLPIK